MVINNTGVAANAGLDIETCDASLNLSAVAPSVGTGSWTQTGGATVTIDNSLDRQTLISGLTGGTYSFTWTVVNGSCSATDVVVVINSSPAVSTPSTPLAEVCNGNATLQGNAPGIGETGLWTGGGSSIIASPTSNNTTASSMPLGLNTFTWTLTKGITVNCISANSVNIANNQVVATAGVDKTTGCENFVNLSGNDPTLTQGSGLWTDESATTASFVDNTLYNTLVNNIRVGTTIFRWTVTQGGCSAQDDVVITNNQIVADAGTDQTTCNTYYDPLDGNDVSGSGGTGVWSASGTGQFVNSSLYNTRVYNLQSGINTLTWTVTSAVEGCTHSDDVDIVSNAVQASAGVDFTICGTNSASLSAQPPVVGTGSWSVPSGAPINIDNSLLFNSDVSNLAQGLNVLRWTVTYLGCTEFDEVTITNNSPDVADAGTDITTCDNTVSLNGNNPTVGTGVWTTTSGSASIDNASFNLTSVTVPSGITTFTWTITNNGCQSSDDVEVNNGFFSVSVNADDITCNGTYTFLATNPTDVGSGTGTGEWTVVSGSGTFANSTDPNTSVTMTDLINRESIFRWTITDGLCSASDDVKITNDEVSASGTDFMTCNDNATITANDPSLLGASGIWSMDFPAGQSINNTTAFSTTVSDLVPNNINSFRWTVSRGICSATDVIDVEYFVPNADITLPPSITQCVDTIELRADPNLGTGSGVWTIVFGTSNIVIDNSTSPTTVARNLDVGNNVFQWTVTDRGCTSSEQVAITNNMPINTAGTDKAACDSVFLMDAQVPTPTGSGIWSLISGSVSFTDQTSATTTVTAKPGTNIVKWTITDNGCSNSKQFTISNNLTAPNAGIDVAVCENQVRLSGNVPKPGESGVWSIDGGIVSEVFSSTTVNNPEVTNLRQGIITFVWTVTNGICTAEDRVVITNNTPVADAGPDETICEDYVTLNGNNPAVDGATGVWSIGSSAVSIANPTFYATNVTNLSQGSNLFTWTVDNGICTASDDVLITSNAIDVVAGIPYTEDCADTLYLEATVPPVGTTGFWTAVEGGGTFDDATSYTTIARNLGNFNKLRWTITDGTCSFYDEIDFVSLLPTQANTQADKAVCADYTQITANPPDVGQGESGLWTKVIGSSSVTIADPTAFQTDVTNLDAGLNQFKWTISNTNCSTSDLINITNNQVFANAGNDQVICDSSATISANVTTGTGYWTTSTPGVVITNSVSANTAVSSLIFGNNNFQWNVTYNGCTDQDEVIVRSDLSRNVSAGVDTNICVNYYNLAATNPGTGTGLWTLVGGAGTFANETANQTTVSGISVGNNIFRWTVTVGSCSEFDEVIVANNSIYVTAGTDQTLCNQDTLVLDGTIPGSGITGTWSVNGGSGTFDNVSVYNTTVRTLTKGTNTYVWTLTDGSCSNSAEVEVIVNTPDSAKVGADQFICADNTTINAVAVSNGTGQWSLSSGTGVFADHLNPNTEVTGINVGLNTYTWTVTKNGCSLSADVDVTNNSVNAYIADDDIVICTPTHTGTIIANAVGAGETGYWTKMSSGAGDITDSQDNVTTVTSLGNGETYFRWTVENGSCSNFDELRITNNYYNTTAAPAGPSTLCVDYSPIIGGSLPIGATGKWSSTAPDVTFDDDTRVSTIVRDLPGGTSSITWTVTKDGCSSPASFNLLNNAIYTSAGADQVVCNTSTSLNAQGLLSGESGVWTVNNGVVTITNTADPATTVNNLIVGDNTFTWTLTGNGCTVSDDVIISNNTFGVDAGVDQISCGSSYTLRGSDPLTGTGLWTVSSGTGRFLDPTNYETLVEDMENGPNTFTWTVNRNGCEASADVTITNDLYAAIAGDDRSVCSEQTTVSAQPLNPTWGASGMWTAQTGGGVFNNPSIESTLVTGLSGGDNRLRWTVTKGTCVSFDEIIITNNAITASAGTDETTCNDYATLSATPLSTTGVGLWTAGGAGLVTIANPTSATTAVTNLQQGVNTFAWTVTDNGCTGTSTVRITSNYFTARAGSDQIVTVDNVVLDADLPGAGATGTWSVFSGAGTFANINDQATTATGLGYGMNTFRWTVDWNSCVAYDDVNVTYNVINPVAGGDQVICTDRVYLTADDPWPGTGAWTRVSGSGTIVDPLNNTTEVTDILPGSVNIYRWTVSISGYSEYDDVVITNGEFETSAGIDRAACYDYVTLAAEPAGSGTGAWTVLAGAGNFANLSLHNTQVTNLEGDVPNIFVWTVTKPTGCVDSDTVQVVYNVPPTAEFETDVTGGCSPIDVTYTNTSTGGSTYYWFFGDDQRTDSSLTSFTRQYTAYDRDSTFNTTLIAYSDAGCSDTIIHAITAYSIPLVAFEAYPPTQVFPDATINIENLSGDGYDNYDWDYGDGSNGDVHLTLYPSFSYTYDTWGEFTITLNVSSVNSSAECTDVATQTIQILAPQPTDNAGGGRLYTGCEPYTANLSANTLYADRYYWDFHEEGYSTQEDPEWIFETSGTYLADLWAWGPGTGEDSVWIRTDTIEVYEFPIVDLVVKPDTVMLPNQPIHCYNRSTYGDDFRWEFGDGSDPSDEENPLHYYTEEGEYWVTLTVYTDNGCYDSKTAETPIVVEPPGVCKFPNAFSPSSTGASDGRYDPDRNDISNDVFYPVHNGIREYKLEIFNRWGEKIFESTDPAIGWNGYIDGKLAPQDVYVWKVEGKYRNGVIFKDAGDITLLR
jgi:hypothetical protein